MAVASYLPSSAVFSSQKGAMATFAPIEPRRIVDIVTERLEKSILMIYKQVLHLIRARTKQSVRDMEVMQEVIAGTSRYSRQCVADRFQTCG